MINILKGSANTVVLTLTEKQTIDPCDFLFQFTNQMTGEKKIFSAADTSLEVGRYNQFTITENATEDFYNATVELEKGFWKYEVYEMTPTSPANLDPDDAISTLELGKVYVYDNVSDQPAEFEADFEKDVKQWNG